MVKQHHYMKKIQKYMRCIREVQLFICQTVTYDSSE